MRGTEDGARNEIAGHLQPVLPGVITTQRSEAFRAHRTQDRAETRGTALPRQGAVRPDSLGECRGRALENGRARRERGNEIGRRRKNAEERRCDEWGSDRRGRDAFAVPGREQGHHAEVRSGPGVAVELLVQLWRRAEKSGSEQRAKDAAGEEEFA
jgi:hypothetical protein